MSSTRRTISSRSNGARVRGPDHPRRTTRSFGNDFRDGLIGQVIVLENESRKGFDSLHSAFVARFGPAVAVKLGLVEERLSAFWRHRRAGEIEIRIMIMRSPPSTPLPTS